MSTSLGASSPAPRSPSSSSSSEASLARGASLQPHPLAASIAALPARDSTAAVSAAGQAQGAGGGMHSLALSSPGLLGEHHHQHSYGELQQQQPIGAAAGAAQDAKAKSAQLRDFLDLADGSTRLAQPEVNARLEQKRLEHERQREIQKKAFEEQMRLLELKQQREEQELMHRNANSAAESGAAAHPVRSRSGNDLDAFGSSSHDPALAMSPSSQAAHATGSLRGTPSALAGGFGNGAASRLRDASRSMPASRRHSGEHQLGLSSPLSAHDSSAVRSASRDGAGGAIPSNLGTFFLDDDDAGWPKGAAAYIDGGAGAAAADDDKDKFPVLSGLPRVYKGSSEWPAFERNGTSPVEQLQQRPHQRAVTLDAVTMDEPSPAARPGVLPPPAGSRLGGAATTGTGTPIASRRASPTATLNHAPQLEQGFVDSVTDHFAHFNLDTSTSTPTSAFGGYENSFAYDYPHHLGAKPRAYASSTLGASTRAADAPSSNRFAGLRLEDLQGDMLSLCKDQFGCRFLQKKLEDGNPVHRDMIFHEIFAHFGELMVDPFANYLSQRMLEHCTDEQRDALIEAISPELASISLNMHGTRAVQKLIDCLSTKRQVQSLILALNLNVVTLIKDLNGNHVIQKCLQQLAPEDKQFVYNAVATHCIEVATHRHGCCVLQRCIDHASESQRIQLVTEITYNSLTLVQDAFGNYVVQYVLDLNDPRFIEAIVRQFLGNVSALSAQKFSSNVVEKCIRVADPAGRRAIIDELLQKQRLERLLRDSFANYVVQTALDYAEQNQRQQLIDAIRPILPMIRNTPYGKRIQSKIQRDTNDHHGGGGGHHGGRHHHHHAPHQFNGGGGGGRWHHGGPPPPPHDPRLVPMMPAFYGAPPPPMHPMGPYMHAPPPPGDFGAAGRAFMGASLGSSPSPSAGSTPAPPSQASSAAFASFHQPHLANGYHQLPPPHHAPPPPLPPFDSSTAFTNTNAYM